MAIKDFTAEEICKIVESVKNSNISCLKFGKLEIQLESPNISTIQNQVNSTPIAMPAIPSKTYTSEEIEEEKELELDELLIANPAEFEKIVADGRSD